MKSTFSAKMIIAILFSCPNTKETVATSENTLTLTGLLSMPAVCHGFHYFPQHTQHERTISCQTAVTSSLSVRSTTTPYLIHQIVVTLLASSIHSEN